MRVSIDLDCEAVSRLVYNELVEAREAFLENMEEDRPSIFSMNELYDKMIIQKHIDALELIIEWYRDPSA